MDDEAPEIKARSVPGRVLECTATWPDGKQQTLDYCPAQLPKGAVINHITVWVTREHLSADIPVTVHEASATWNTIAQDVKWHDDMGWTISDDAPPPDPAGVG